MTIGIYCIENLVNGKKYIGKSANIKRRFAEHRHTLNVIPYNGKANRYLHSSVQKHGYENFKFYIIEEIAELDHALLADREVYWIEYFDTCNRKLGYNLMKESSIGVAFSEESLRLMSEASKGRRHTEESKRKIGLANGGTNSYMFGVAKTKEQIENVASKHRGVPKTSEQKLKMSEAQKGKFVSPETCKRISESKIGHKMSEETKSKMSDSRKGSNNPSHAINREARRLLLLTTGTKMKPMLATTLCKFETLNFPVYISTKLDGYRCLIHNGIGVSRNLKPIRNVYIQKQIEMYKDVLDGFDGELCLEDLTAPFNEVSSAISAEDGCPRFKFVIFDYHAGNGNYQERFLDNLDRKFPDFVVVVPMKLVNNQQELVEAHTNWTSQGFEGTMVRRADGLDTYKYGRSTEKQAYLLKIKDFADDEAVILDFVERQHNGNEATKDNLGHTKRSSHLENMVGRGDLGAIVAKSDKFSEPFNIGSGFDDILRAEMWDNREQYLGKLVTFTHQPSGAKAEGKPRFPVFKAFREEWDMS